MTEELVEGPPSRRANATLTACPSGHHLWCIGGEFFSDDGKAVSVGFQRRIHSNSLQYFYNDVFRYTPEKVMNTTYCMNELAQLFTGRMEEICIANMPWPSFSPRSRCNSRWGRKDLSFWCAMPPHGRKVSSSINLGGEFSSLHQNTFHHYRDFWCFDISSHSWDRIETKIRPSARSGHR